MVIHMYTQEAHVCSESFNQWIDGLVPRHYSILPLLHSNCTVAQNQEAHKPTKNGLIALQTPRTSRLSTFCYCQVVSFTKTTQYVYFSLI